MLRIKLGLRRLSCDVYVTAVSIFGEFSVSDAANGEESHSVEFLTSNVLSVVHHAAGFRHFSLKEDGCHVLNPTSMRRTKTKSRVPSCEDGETSS